MAKDFAKRFYNSKQWKICRDNYFKSKHGVCERCGEPGKIVHHIKYLTPENISDPFISLNWDNLELLCQSCHNEEHDVQQDYYFDENGDMVVKHGKDKKSAAA